jgi:hypothetical protein
MNEKYEIKENILFHIIMSFCQYKDILGKPRQGIHSYRLFGLAIAPIVLC